MRQDFIFHSGNLLIKLKGWITFAVAGVMQGLLLIMCIYWHRRQQRLGIDDFGNPIDRAEADSNEETPLLQGS